MQIDWIPLPVHNGCQICYPSVVSRKFLPKKLVGYPNCRIRNEQKSEARNSKFVLCRSHPKDPPKGGSYLFFRNLWDMTL